MLVRRSRCPCRGLVRVAFGSDGAEKEYRRGRQVVPDGCRHRDLGEACLEGSAQGSRDAGVSGRKINSDDPSIQIYLRRRLFLVF